jgi:hypothetical protein
MIEIQLTRGLVTQIDDEFEFLDQHKWYALKVRGRNKVQYYATRKIRVNNIQSACYMHRVIMETSLNRTLLKTEEIDHINYDGLRNTTDNLRIATHQQNMMNRRKPNINAASQYKGVTWHKKSSKWQAQIRKNGKHIHLGLFLTDKDAAQAADTAAKLYFGEYANLNFPET